MLLFVTMLEKVAEVGSTDKEAVEIAVEDLEDVIGEVTFVLKLTQPPAGSGVFVLSAVVTHTF